MIWMSHAEPPDRKMRTPSRLFGLMFAYAAFAFLAAVVVGVF